VTGVRAYPRSALLSQNVDGGPASRPTRRRSAVRVDFYDVDGEDWFGELTPYPGGGLDPFDPALDDRLGTLGRLPSRSAARARQ
jgi:hypothetical protein